MKRAYGKLDFEIELNRDRNGNWEGTAYFIEADDRVDIYYTISNSPYSVLSQLEPHIAGYVHQADQRPGTPEDAS